MMDIFVILTDLYFIRRFLDKEYIDTGIVYTGIIHSVDFVYVLLKYFDFDITNYSYLSKSPIELKQIIKKLDNSRKLDKYIFPPKLKQCSDLTKFPKLFA